MTIQQIKQRNVIVVGAGMAGMGAAIELAKDPSIRVTLLEAKNRLGGRICTIRNLISPELETMGLVPPGTSNLSFDFGASWIHGATPANPLFALAKTGHIDYVHTDSDVMFFTPGQGEAPLSEADREFYWKTAWEILDYAKEHSTKCRDQIPETLSFRTWLTEHLDSYQSMDPEGEKYMSEKTKSVIPGMCQHWADENAIPLERVSMKYMDAEVLFPGDHCLVINGYDRIVKVLASSMQDVRVLLEHVVEGIEYTESEVKVSTNKGTFVADQIIVTFPLGVLKAQPSTFFSPPLPQSKRLAIDRLCFGTMFKIVLPFPRCFWPTKKHFLKFLPSATNTRKPSEKLIAHFGLNSQQIEALTVYMNDLANYSSFMPLYNLPILVGYATNHAAELMERLTEVEARTVYMCQLSHYYGILTSDKPGEGKDLLPKISFKSKWNLDPFAGGSYTSIPVGATPKDIEAFQVAIGARPYEPLALGANSSDDEAATAEINKRFGNINLHLNHTNNNNNNNLHGNGNDSSMSSSTSSLTMSSSSSSTSLSSSSSSSEDEIGSLRFVSVDDAETGRVFFAGEHTSSRHFASLQGALLTGQREAAKILVMHQQQRRV